MSARNIAFASKDTQTPSGLRLLLLESIPPDHALPATVFQAQSKASQLADALPADNSPPGSFAAKTALHRQLTALCLHNPYWNDFRLLNHFNRRKMCITMADLHRLKAECGLDNRETICNTLIRLAIHGGLQLNNRQISFVEKIDPAFRDRDVRPALPGELFAYECLFGRGIGDIGRVHVHLFVDMFNGYTFGELGPHRSINAGLRLLTEAIIPLYHAHNLVVQTIAHSTRVINDVKEFDQMESAETFSRIGLQWLPTRRQFGVVEKFAKNLLRDHFFEQVKNNAVDIADLQPAFNQWLKKYNAANRLLQHRKLLD